MRYSSSLKSFRFEGSSSSRWEQSGRRFLDSDKEYPIAFDRVNKTYKNPISPENSILQRLSTLDMFVCKIVQRQHCLDEVDGRLLGVFPGYDVSQDEVSISEGALVSALTPAARFLLNRSPIGNLVRWVAGLKVSVHAKLLAGFLIVTLFFIGMGVMSLQTLAKMSSQGQLLDEAHERVHWSQDIQHALALQMNFTAMALLLKDEATIANILRENNRFNNTLARLEEFARPEERELIQRIRAAQESALTTVADIANLVRDGRVDAAMALQLNKEYPLYLQIEGLVDQVVKREQQKMDSLRESVAATNRRSLIIMAGFVASSIAL